MLSFLLYEQSFLRYSHFITTLIPRTKSRHEIPAQVESRRGNKNEARPKFFTWGRCASRKTRARDEDDESAWRGWREHMTRKTRARDEDAERGRRGRGMRTTKTQNQDDEDTERGRRGRRTRKGVRRKRKTHTRRRCIRILRNWKKLEKRVLQF